IWYFYEYNYGAQRGVLLIGNPVIMWGGLIALLACLYAWLKNRDIRTGATALLWIASLAIYVVIPKSLGFYYYYHLSGIFICLMLAMGIRHFELRKARGIDEWFAAASLIVFI